MTDKTADNWSNYWRGRAGQESGAALVGAGIENDAELSAFWTDVFTGADEEARVLDLACGAGSALKHAASANLTKLAGADISADALASLAKAVPVAIVAECSAADTPFEDDMFDYVVSQFGIEYAGLNAAAREAARVLASGGKFIAIVHMTGGGIEKEVSERLLDGKAIQETNFVPLAKDVFTTAQQPRTEDNLARAKEAGEAFQPAEQALGKIASEKGGLAAHLYGGARQMYGKVMNYALPDILGWLDSMNAEIDAYVGRMSSMIEAAATEAEAQSALGVLTEGGCTIQPLERFQLDGKDVAWVLRASKI